MRTISGIGLIATERQEQIEKHGFSPVGDDSYFNEELIQGAKFALSPDTEPFPENWDQKYADKIRAKDMVGRLAVAGAFAAAEIDRRLIHEGSEVIPRQEVIALIDNMLMHGDHLIDAVSNEHTDIDGEWLLELSESTIEKK